MDRLSAFIVRRLRHMSRRAVLRRAARTGLLTSDVVVIDGHAVRRYTPAFDLSGLTGNIDRDMQWIRREFASFLIEPPKDRSGDIDSMAPALVLPPHLRRKLPSSELAANERAAYAMKMICDAGEKLGVKHISSRHSCLPVPSGIAPSHCATSPISCAESVRSSASTCPPKGLSAH